MIYSPDWILDTFCYRRDAYAFMTRHPWQINYSKGETTRRENYYDRVYAPITRELITKHLMGKITIATFPTRIEDQTVKYLCWDIDEPGNDLFMSVIRTAKSTQKNFSGSKILIEASGAEGHYHIWLLLERPVLLKDARRYLRDRRIEGIDSFPNQDVVINDYYFELPIKVPCGYHRAANRFSEFVDENLNVIQI